MRYLMLVITGLALFVFTSNAQVPLQFSQVFKTLEFVNPAYSAFESTFTGKMMFRSQWQGMEGHPTTTGATIYSPLKNYKLGLGGTLVNYMHGSYVQTNLSVSMNIDLRVNRRDNIAFGLTAGGEFSYFDHSKVVTYWDIDPNGESALGYENIDEKGFFNPTFGLGMMYYSDLFYAGLSSFLMINENKNLAFSFYQGSYLTTGFTQKITREWFLKETVLIKLMNNDKSAFELGVNVAYRDLLWFGTAHRWKDSQIFLGDMKSNRQLRLGVSFDAQLSALKQYTMGSFEVRLEYRSVRKKRAVDKSRTFYNLN